MPWEIEYTNEFGEWWVGLLEKEQDAVAASVELLSEYGPSLPFPYSSDIKSSRYGHMRELRVRRGGKPIRVFYAFDPRRTSILLIGEETRQATIDSMKNMYQQLMLYTRII